MVLNFQQEFLIKELKKLKPKKVLVQLPEGVKTQALDLQEKIKQLGIEIIFSGETAWGGCCLATDEAKKVGADLIVHFGHTEFIKSDFPVLYVEIQDKLDLKKILEKSLTPLKNIKKIGLGFSVQHKNDLKTILDFYKKNGKEIILTKKSGRVFYEGQIIGCEYSGLKNIEKQVDAFVVVGNRFHSIGASLSVGKPVFLLDVYNDEVQEMSQFKDKIIRERALAIDKFKHSKNVGIILETKLGQVFGNHQQIANKLEKSGKKVLLITMNEITPEKIMNFYNIDAFVELACPRIAIDDYSRYEKPILTSKESLVAIGEKSWEDLVENGFL